MSESEDQKPSIRYNGNTKPNMNFPPLPHTVTEVSRLLAEMEEEPDTLKLAEIVDSDPVVAAAVLRRINSAYYGMRRRIGNVRKAVMLLGFLEVANIVLTAGMIKLEEVFASNEHSDIFEKIMQLSVGVGQCAREIADYLELPIQGQVYTAGLLHAVGRLVFLYNHPEEYTSLWEAEGDEGPPSIKAERAVFGVANTEIGAQAADEWKLPKSLVQAIQFYPAPEHIEDEENRLIATLLSVAISVVRQLRSEATEEVPLEAPAELDRLADLTGADPEALLEHLQQKREQIQSYVDTMTFR